jgi:AcrR family transcriptional regulator
VTAAGFPADGPLRRPATGVRGALRPRRTQAERRAATRAVLLEACVDCLLELGYTRLTIGEVVRRAGVSRGAQTHHFSTKAELVVAALRHLIDLMAVESGEGREVADPAAAWAQLLDRLWSVHSDRSFPALLELWVAARTESELRQSLVELERDMSRQVLEHCRARMPELVERPDFRAALSTALAAMRGLALVDSFGRDGERDQLWAGVRGRLLALV